METETRTCAWAAPETAIKTIANKNARATKAKRMVHPPCRSSFAYPVSLSSRAARIERHSIAWPDLRSSHVMCDVCEACHFRAEHNWARPTIHQTLHSELGLGSIPGPPIITDATFDGCLELLSMSILCCYYRCRRPAIGTISKLNFIRLRALQLRAELGLWA